MCRGFSETPVKHRQWKGSIQAQGIQARDRRDEGSVVCNLSGWSESRSVRAVSLSRSASFYADVIVIASYPTVPQSRVSYHSSFLAAVKTEITQFHLLTNIWQIQHGMISPQHDNVSWP